MQHFVVLEIVQQRERRAETIARHKTAVPGTRRMRLLFNARQKTSSGRQMSPMRWPKRDGLFAR